MKGKYNAKVKVSVLSLIVGDEQVAVDGVPSASTGLVLLAEAGRRRPAAIQTF